MAFNSNTKEYKMLTLASIRFDEKIADMVEKQGHVFPSALMNSIYSTETFKLDQGRLTRILDGYKTGLPPISVKKGLGDTFILVNGRHRICATIINGGDVIPAKIIVN